jgi:hypothetical protein
LQRQQEETSNNSSQHLFHRQTSTQSKLSS